jgi:hypothetical protein
VSKDDHVEYLSHDNMEVNDLEREDVEIEGRHCFRRSWHCWQWGQLGALAHQPCDSKRRISIYSILMSWLLNQKIVITKIRRGEKS